MMEYYSQIYTCQDKFVAETLNFKKDGTFLDIGCHHYKDISNTYFLEKELNWRGIAIDIDNRYENEWKQYRLNSSFIKTDATTLDYANILENAKMPKIIDYLSLDIEPPESTLKALIKLFETDYIFRVVTYETDYYRNDFTKDISRKIFKDRGYKFIKEMNAQDDYYVYPNI